MAKFTLTNAAVKVAGVEISDHVREVGVQMTAPEVTFPAMGGSGTSRAQGIRDDRFTLTAYSDMAAASIDATLWPIFSGGSYVVVEVWAAGTVSAATNPKYWGTCILTEYSPISGAVGDPATTPLTLPVNGLISRATT